MLRKIGLAAIIVIVIFQVVLVLQYMLNSSSREQAIQEARSFSPTGVCVAHLTPAIHDATGAKFTFPSSCLAPGWHEL